MLPPRRHLGFYTYLLLLGVSLAMGCLTGAPASRTPVNESADGLVFYTEQLPPYNYIENGTLQGISVDLLEAMTRKMGGSVSRDQVHLVPWTQGYRAAITQDNAVIFTTARFPEREMSFKWVGPIQPYINALFARYDREIVIQGPGNLTAYRIGVIIDDCAIQQLWDAGVKESQLVYETDVRVIIHRLESGEIDLWCYNQDAARYFTRQETGKSYSFNNVYTLPALYGYYAFSRNTPDATVQSFQNALDSLKEERDSRNISTYDRIAGHYVPSVGLGQLQYLTEEWAPYNYEENGRATGIAVEILEAVFRNVGVNRSRADVRIVPLAEGFRETQNSSTVLFSIVRTPEREPFYKWAGPFTKSGFVVFAPVARNITIRQSSDLNRYRVGAVQSSIENDLLASQGVNASNIIPGATPADLLRMLDSGQIDLWATGDRAGRHQMIRAAGNPNAFEIIYTLSENEFYFIFSRDVPDLLVDAFQEALEAVRTRKDIHGVSDYERILYHHLGVGCTRKPFTDEAVRDLVSATAAAIEKNASDTLMRINAGESPYRDPLNPALYVFVYDTNVTFVAHADNPFVVGLNYKGKTDVTGEYLHDEIVVRAQKNGTGWLEYVFTSPVETNLYYKTTYFRLTEGSDGKTYVVCSGNFKGCKD